MLVHHLHSRNQKDLSFPVCTFREIKNIPRSSRTPHFVAIRPPFVNHAHWFLILLPILNNRELRLCAWPRRQRTETELTLATRPVYLVDRVVIFVINYTPIAATVKRWSAVAWKFCPPNAASFFNLHLFIAMKSQSLSFFLDMLILLIGHENTAWWSSHT